MSEQAIELASLVETLTGDDWQALKQAVDQRSHAEMTDKSRPSWMSEEHDRPCPGEGCGARYGHSMLCPLASVEQKADQRDYAVQKWHHVIIENARLKHLITFWQGKHALLRQENNKLRRKAEPVSPLIEGWRCDWNGVEHFVISPNGEYYGRGKTRAEAYRAAFEALWQQRQEQVAEWKERGR